jgi:hypothetical protein
MSTNTTIMHSLLSSLRTFAHYHDDFPAFHAGYLVLTFLIAAMFNMGAFALLVLAHMALDIVKYREVHRYSWMGVAQGVIRESLVDITLLFVGFVFAVYLHHSVSGIASLSGLMRAEVTIIRALGTIIPKLKILHHILKVIAHIHHYIETVHPHINKELTSLERACVILLMCTGLLLIIAPWILELNVEMMLQIVKDELIPWTL